MSDLVAVVPARNAATTLGAALASVVGQSRRPDVVVVVDDGSTDGTADVARSYERYLPLQLVVQPTHFGLSAAFSTALQGRTGRFLRLDADDVWFPDHVQTLERRHDDQGGVVSADAITWRPGGGLSRRSWFDVQPLPPVHRQLEVLASRNIVLSATIMEVDTFQEAGGYAEMPSMEDWDLWIRLAERAVPFAATGHPTMLYRQSERSRSKGSIAARETAELLSQFSRTTTDEQIRTVAARSASQWRAKAELFDAQSAAREGRRGAARAKALAAVRRGSRQTRVRAVATTLAPFASTRAYDRIRRRS